MADRISNFYPTSILHRSLSGMEENNQQLAALIRAMEKSDPNFVAGTTTEGGFQTSPELFKRDHPALNALKRPRPSRLRIASPMTERAELPVHRNSTL